MTEWLVVCICCNKEWRRQRKTPFFAPSHLLTVTDSLSKLGTPVWYLLIRDWKSIKLITVTCCCHSGCWLPYPKSLASYITARQGSSVQGMLVFRQYSVLQGNVATRLRCGGMFNKRFIANFLLSVLVKELWKSVNIWRKYGQEFGVLFFDSRCIWSHSTAVDFFCNSALIILMLMLFINHQVVEVAKAQRAYSTQLRHRLKYAK